MAFSWYKPLVRLTTFTEIIFYLLSHDNNYYTKDMKMSLLRAILRVHRLLHHQPRHHVPDQLGSGLAGCCEWVDSQRLCFDDCWYVD